MPSGKGFLPAFWMMPTDENLYGQWPKCGEIDITEVHGSQPDTAYSTLHFGEPHTQRQNTYTLKKSDFSKDFHVYACEWEPGEIRFYIDNKLFYTVNDWFTKKEGFDEVTYPAPFDQPYYIILNLAVGGSWVGYPDETTAFGDNAQMVVDYVKVYQKDSYKETVKKPENTVKLRKPDKSGNYVVNSNFAKAEKLNDGKNWEFLLAGTGDASAKISKNALHITTKNAGDLDYSVQVVQPNIPMEQGYQYKLSFDAYADKNRTMITAITAPDNGYIRYFNDTKVNLTTKKKTYSYTFDMKSATDANGRVEFNLGNQGSTAGVHITNVKVVKVKKISTKEEKSVRPDGNYVYNGEFQEGADRLNYWTVKKAKGASVKVTNTNNVRQLKAVVPASVKKASDVTVKQTKVAVKGGKSYVLSFDAKRTGAKDQTLIVKIAGKTYKAKLTGSMKTYKFELKPKKGTKNATLEFQLGTKGTTYIDNVRIMENGLIINGDFSAGMTGFEAWANNPSDVSYVVDTLKEDSAFSMDIKDTGDQDWHIQLKQTGVKLEKGQNYKISFKAKATTDRDIKFVFQRNGLKRKNADGSEDWTVYFSDEQILVTKKWQTYSAVFEMKEDTDADTSMSFNFGAIGGKRITDKHTVLIDDIVLEKTDEKVKEEEDDSLIINGHFTKGLSPFETWAHDSAKMESGVDNDKVFYATIYNTGSEDWHAQLKQVNIPLEKGQYYTFSFRAKSDLDRNIKYAFQKDGNKHNDDWTVYFEESNIPVTKEWKTYTTVFKMEKDTDKESSFSFNLGAVGKQIKDKHTVMIDDVVLRVATEEEKKGAKKNEASSSGDYTPSSPKGTTDQKDLPKQTLITKDATNNPANWKASNATVTSNEGKVEATLTAADAKIVCNQKFDASAYHKVDAKVTLKSDANMTVKVGLKPASAVPAEARRQGIQLMSGSSRLMAGSESDGFVGDTKTVSLTADTEQSVTVRSDVKSQTGNLVIAIEVEGAANGNKLSISNVSLADANELAGANNMSNSLIWTMWADSELGGSATAVKTENKNEYVLDIKSVGTSKDYSVTYRQDNISVEAGKKYKVTFDAKSSKARTISAGFMDPKNDYYYMGGKEFDLTTDYQEYTFDIPSGNPVKTTKTGMLQFSLGYFKDKPCLPSTVSIRNVVMEEVVSGSEPEELGEELLTNGDFSNGESNWENAVTAPGAAEVSFDTGKAVYNISNVGTEEWHIQLKYTPKLRLGKNGKYKVSFKVKSSEARTIKYAFMQGDSDWYGGDALQLEKDQTLNVCKPIDISKETSENITFIISMGKISDGTSVSSIIEIDDISVQELDAGETGGNQNPPSDPGESFEVPNTSQPAYEVQKNGNFTAESGHVYKLQCKVTSTINRNVTAVMNVSDSFTEVKAKEIALVKDQETPIELIAAYHNDSGSSIAGHFQLNMGNTTGLEAHTITVKDWEVTDITDTVNLISDPKFSNGLEKWGWWHGINEDAGAAGSAITAEGSITYTLSSFGTADWNVQLAQEGISLEAGKTYKGYIDCEADQAKKISVGVQAKSDNSWYGGTTVAVESNKKTTISFEFTMNTSDTNAKFYVSMGKHDGETVEAATITLSNLKLFLVP